MYNSLRYNEQMVPSTTTWVESGTCTSLLVSYKPLFHTIIPYFLTYKTVKRAAVLKNGERSNLSCLKTVLPKNSPWSPYSTHWALAHWNKNLRIKESKGRLDRLRKWGQEKKEEKKKKGILEARPYVLQIPVYISPLFGMLSSRESSKSTYLLVFPVS